MLERSSVFSIGQPTGVNFKRQCRIRKIEIGAMLVNALQLDRVPPPLDGVLVAV
jgi:hypothetical protein